MLHHEENKVCLIHFYIHVLNYVFSKFSFTVFRNGPQALSVNLGCSKCNSSTNLSPFNKNLLMSFFQFKLTI